MGVIVEITKVNEEADYISFNKDGESDCLEVIRPAQLKWARLGKAEIFITNDKKVNFIKSLEPKPSIAHSVNEHNRRTIPQRRAISTVEIFEDVTLSEFKEEYDKINADEDKKCGASTLFQRHEGNYDAALYVTTFVTVEVTV